MPAFRWEGQGDRLGSPGSVKLRRRVGSLVKRTWLHDCPGLPLRWALGCLVALALACGIAIAQQPAAPPDPPKPAGYRPADPLNATAYERFYNLDYDRAVPDFQRVLDRHPDDPFAVNHLLTAILFRDRKSVV